MIFWDPSGEKKLTEIGNGLAVSQKSGLSPVPFRSGFGDFDDEDRHASAVHLDNRILPNARS
jgi:hypothetical protein